MEIQHFLNHVGELSVMYIPCAQKCASIQVENGTSFVMCYVYTVVS